MRLTLVAIPLKTDLLIAILNIPFLIAVRIRASASHAILNTFNLFPEQLDKRLIEISVYEVKILAF